MSLALVDQLTAIQTDRYHALHLALRGAADAFLSGPYFGTALSFRHLDGNVRGALAGAEREMGESLTQHTRMLVQAARESISQQIPQSWWGSGDELLRANLESATQATGARLSSALDSSAQGATLAMRRFALRVEMLARSRGWEQRAALVRLREQGRADFKLSIVDRAGRSWEAHRYVHTLVRGHYLAVFNETTLFALAENGHETARIVAPGKSYDGKRIAIVEAGELPSYESLIPEYFHPNGGATVAPDM